VYSLCSGYNVLHTVCVYFYQKVILTSLFYGAYVIVFVGFFAKWRLLERDVAREGHYALWASCRQPKLHYMGKSRLMVAQFDYLKMVAYNQIINV